MHLLIFALLAAVAAGQTIAVRLILNNGVTYDMSNNKNQHSTKNIPYRVDISKINVRRSDYNPYSCNIKFHSWFVRLASKLSVG